jgi:hypothetical protein
VGVIFIRPQVYGLLDKIGVSVHADTSGRNKDMGSPFRRPTPEEDKLFSKLVEDLAGKFTSKVAENRKISPENMKLVATARVFTADDALAIGLVDKTATWRTPSPRPRSSPSSPPTPSWSSTAATASPTTIPTPEHQRRPGQASCRHRFARSRRLRQGRFYYLWDAATP